MQKLSLASATRISSSYRLLFDKKQHEAIPEKKQVPEGKTVDFCYYDLLMVMVEANIAKIVQKHNFYLQPVKTDVVLVMLNVGNR